MKSNLEIIRFNGRDYLCHEDGETFINVSNPMLDFTKEEDEFEVIPADPSYLKKIYHYRKCEVCLVPALYPNGWLGIYLQDIKREDTRFVLTVNIEESQAFGLPSHTFVDCNNESGAMAFLIANGLATDMRYSRRSGFVDYPMVDVNLPLLYRHCPEAFERITL